MIFVLVVFLLAWFGAAMVNSDRERPFTDAFFNAIWITPAFFMLGWLLSN